MRVAPFLISLLGPRFVLPALLTVARTELENAEWRIGELQDEVPE